MFTSTFSFAGNERLFSESKLAAELRTTNADFKNTFRATAICDLIELRARYGKDNFDLTDLYQWIRSSEGQFEGCTFKVVHDGITTTISKEDVTPENINRLPSSPAEILIEIPSENLAVRYFDPIQANVITPYDDVLSLSAVEINPGKLTRQIIHRTKTSQDRASPNVTCGTICESGHQELLDPQIEAYYKGLAKEAKINKKILTGEDVIDALEKTGKLAELGATAEQLRTIIRHIRQQARIPEDIDILFAIPNPDNLTQKLWWIKDPDTGEDLYAGGHFNKEGTRIHISLPLILDEKLTGMASKDAALAIAEHDYKHIKGEEVEHTSKDLGMKIVIDTANIEKPHDENALLFEYQYITGEKRGPDGKLVPWQRPQSTTIDDVNEVVGTRGLLIKKLKAIADTYMTLHNAPVRDRTLEVPGYGVWTFMDVPMEKSSGNPREVEISKGDNIALGTREIFGCIGGVLTWSKNGKRYIWLIHDIPSPFKNTHIKSKIKELKSDKDISDIKAFIHASSRKKDFRRYRNAIANYLGLSKPNIVISIKEFDNGHSYPWTKESEIIVTYDGVILTLRSDRKMNKVLLWDTMETCLVLQTKANVTCGTICERGHQELLDPQIEAYYRRLASKTKINKKILTGEDVIYALEKTGKLAELGATKEQLQTIIRHIRQQARIPEDIDILFAIPNPDDLTQKLWWIEDPKTGEDLYAGGHFNQAGTRIHISLPLILSQVNSTEAALAIARHDYKHIKREEVKHIIDDPGMAIVVMTADAERHDVIRNWKVAKETEHGKTVVLRERKNELEEIKLPFYQGEKAEDVLIRKFASDLNKSNWPILRDQALREGIHIDNTNPYLQRYDAVIELHSKEIEFFGGRQLPIRVAVCVNDPWFISFGKDYILDAQQGIIFRAITETGKDGRSAKFLIAVTKEEEIEHFYLALELWGRKLLNEGVSVLQIASIFQTVEKVRAVWEKKFGKKLDMRGAAYWWHIPNEEWLSEKAREAEYEQEILGNIFLNALRPLSPEEVTRENIEHALNLHKNEIVEIQKRLQYIGNLISTRLPNIGDGAHLFWALHITNSLDSGLCDRMTDVLLKSIKEWDKSGVLWVRKYDVMGNDDRALHSYIIIETNEGPLIIDVAAGQIFDEKDGLIIVTKSPKDYKEVVRKKANGWRNPALMLSLMSNYVRKRETVFAPTERMQDVANNSVGPNVSCGTICERGHQELLDPQIEAYYKGLAQAAGLGDRILSGEDVIVLLKRTGKLAKLHTTEEQLRAIIKYIRDEAGIPNSIDILFAIPNPDDLTQKLWWIEDPKTGEALYTGGHFNPSKKNRIHISLPLIMSQPDPQEAALAIARHDYKHIRDERHENDEGMNLVRRVAFEQKQACPDFQLSEAETKKELEARMRREFAKHGIEYEYIDETQWGHFSDKIRFLSLPEEAPWLMDSLRPENKSTPIIESLEDLPVVTSYFDYEKLPLLNDSGTSCKGIFLGLIKRKDGYVHPAAFKLGHISLQELKSIQIFGNHLGILPEFYGILKNKNGDTIGYAMSIVALGSNIPSPYEHEDYEEICKRLEKAKTSALINVAYTRKNRVIGVDAGAFPNEITERYMRFLESPTAQPDRASPINNYIDKNKALFEDLLGENKPPVLLRVPVEAIKYIGVDNIRDFLGTFQEAPNGYVELYSIKGENVIYEDYGFNNKPTPEGFNRTRENTVTLFPALKDEEIRQPDIVLRLGGIDMNKESTILSPIGLEHDPAGLIRGAIFGLRMMNIAREIKEPLDRLKIRDVNEYNRLKDMVQEALETYKIVCDPNTKFEFKTEDIEDLLGLTAWDINCIVRALNKLIKLLPAIAPIDAEELRRIYEHAKEVITAA